MSIGLAIMIGVLIGGIFTAFVMASIKDEKTKAEYEKQLLELKAQHRIELNEAMSRSVSSSRAVLKGKIAEQFAPVFPQFDYLPSDSKFLGDPIDYIVFNGYSQFREGELDAKDIEIILIDIKSGNARLTKGQQAIAHAIKKGRIRFETIRVDF
ncbi:Holliday junction resolvase-like protein [Acinetobacter sp. HY1485]|uniref:Holliday junction resolvase-like protein n=1 Tax=Acinetobacter sp. HY1485 TaxID=2970918 RepID=UPI0022B94395|nr:Holliday junction resolvase-like protein [Acinetobacter sp. HY1485]